MGQAMEMIEEEGGKVEAKAPEAKMAIKLGTLEGVFMPCLLNIWGVMLFLRLTWVIGQAGIIEGLLLMTLANVVTGITTISMSAICTNGQIKSGGVYYMISRSLGPEFGGAIGLMFTLANSIAISMYVIGFCESVLDLCRANIENFTGLFIDGGINDVRIMGSITLTVLLGIAIVGMEWITRVQKVLLVLLCFSQLDFVIGSFIDQDPLERAQGFVGYNWNTTMENLQSGYDGEGFFSVFAVFFPAVTGITAGANMSGDLKDPSTAIPNGTFLAIFFTYVTYIGYGILVGCVYLRKASGNLEEYVFAYNGTGDAMIGPYDCSELVRGNETCQFGSIPNQQTMTIISYTGYLIYFGCFAATLSSAIASLVGAPRVLQALAKDKLYPGIHFFAKGLGPGNDPVRGYVLVFCIALGCILLGDLNMVSGLLSNFFVASYALINFSSFHASVTKSPGWRPAFKYFNPWVSLFGCILCLGCMFLMDWVTAILTFVIISFLYMYLHYNAPEVNWGSSTQAAAFVNALKSVQALTNIQEHVKNFRPKLLILSGNPTHRIPLVDFGNLLTKKMSMMICSEVLTDNTPKNTLKLRNEVQLWLKNKKIAGFYDVLQNRNFGEGAGAVLSLSGLGKLCPNMLLMGFKADWNKDWPRAREYLNIWNQAYQQSMSVIVLRVTGGLDYSTFILEDELVMPENLPGEVDTDVTIHRPVLERKISVEQSGGKKKKSSVDRAQVNKLGLAVNSLVFGGFQPRDVLADVRQFQDKRRRGNIDIWWLYDDGGLPVMLAHILSSRQQFADCKLRVFTLAKDMDPAGLTMFSMFNQTMVARMDQMKMMELLKEFRISTADVTTISNVQITAQPAMWAKLREALSHLPKGVVGEEDIKAEHSMVNKHLRINELLQENSSDAQMIFLTLPQQKQEDTNLALRLATIDLMTRDLPPVLMVGGNDVSVLTSST